MLNKSVAFEMVVKNFHFETLLQTDLILNYFQVHIYIVDLHW